MNLIKSRKLVNELSASKEFNEFLMCLKNLDKSIESEGIEEVIQSVSSIKESVDKVYLRLNSTLKYTIDSYLTESQTKDLDMEMNGDDIDLTFNNYLPGYINNQGVYEMLDLKLIKVNFKDKNVYVYDVASKFDIAEKCKKEELKKESIEIEALKQKIKLMEENRDSQRFVFDTVNEYENSQSKNKVMQTIKYMLLKNSYEEYLIPYDEILQENKEIYNEKIKEYRKIKGYSYLSKKADVIDLQKGIVRRLLSMNFEMSYENENDRLNIVKKPIDIARIYGR